MGHCMAFGVTNCEQSGALDVKAWGCVNVSYLFLTLPLKEAAHIKAPGC